MRFATYPPFPDFYGGWQRLEAGSGPRGTRVAYAGTNIPYYLFGKDLRNDVRYVNVDRHRDWLLHDYHREAMREGAGTWPNPRPGWDRSSPDYAAWLANLDAERINLVVVTRVNPAEGSHNVYDPRGLSDRARVGRRAPGVVSCSLYGRRPRTTRGSGLYRVRRPGG